MEGRNKESLCADPGPGRLPLQRWTGSRGRQRASTAAATRALQHASTHEDSLGRWVAPSECTGVLKLTCWSLLQSWGAPPVGPRGAGRALRGHQPRPGCWVMANWIPSCPYRRGSPLLIGVRSKHKLSTEQVPVLYRPGECLQQGRWGPLPLRPAHDPRSRSFSATEAWPHFPKSLFING